MDIVNELRESFLSSLDEIIRGLGDLPDSHVFLELYSKVVDNEQYNVAVSGMIETMALEALLREDINELTKESIDIWMKVMASGFLSGIGTMFAVIHTEEWR